ncbi:penicillin acylase family protein [Pseudenhygromyxa sp. WMMC2535]|uniref:penicillin acylase family protein n=1 Tax=Pseudenhygromyxa sp. WMMC2535 TaxID=2712867 RepID=UPI001552EF51|nr:penicillin acylase family protein [Pseudenhygromyxa sp. WMMC2535]NVB38877.1 penicillin acylase family protein [Pseudenhygromyxa sp. WMMC2535]
MSPLFLVLGACGGGGADEGGDEAGDERYEYSAQIRRTSYGVAHVQADDWGSLAFGQGYALTEDKGCLLADQIVKVRSQRSRYFGAGEGNANIYGDIAYLQLHLRERAEQGLEASEAWTREAVVGYAAGYNQAVAEGKIGGACAGEDWVPTQIDEVDLFSYYIDLAVLASSRQAIAGIGAAQPPKSGAAPAPAPHVSTLTAHRGVLGSNGWGVGGALSSTGRGMLFANPHFPWEGELQLWESHLVIPGELDVYGVGLLGVPGVLIGFNEDVAWTHTVSDGHRLTLYEIESPEDEPTKYLYEGEVREMSAETFTIDVLQDDGSLVEESRTQWSTHYGPMLALEPFYWTEAFALSYRDANIENTRLVEQFLAMNMAGSLEEFQQVHMAVSGIPWVNTIATSAEGRAWYMDSAATPALSQEAIDAWIVRKDESGFTKALADQDLWLLDGSLDRDAWQEQAGARSSGLVAPANMPQLEREDFVFNANDSYWLANPTAPLTGYSPLHGFTDVGQRLRTRLNATTLLEIAEGGGFAGADGKLDLDELGEAVLANRGMAELLLRDALLARCAGVGTWEVEVEYESAGETLETVAQVELGAACELLAAWDGLLDLDSVGAIIWREWVGDYENAETKDAGELFAEAFDPADPLGTPRGLAEAAGEGDRALDALARAVFRLEQAGLALDTPLGEAQFARKGELRIPMHGGFRNEGPINMMAYEHLRSDLSEWIPRGDVIHASTGLTDEGYLVNYGSSFVMCLQYTDDGPEAKALLSYSQSGDPDSPHFSDQTELFSAKQWRPVLWREQDIAADPNLSSYEVVGGERLD